MLDGSSDLACSEVSCDEWTIRAWEGRGGGKSNLFGIGGAQDLAPLRNGMMLLENHDSDGPACHERHQAVKKWLSFVLLIKLRRFVRRQSDDTLSENSET